MKLRLCRQVLLPLILVTFSISLAHSQDSSSVISIFLSLPDKVFSRIDKESARLEKKIAAGTNRYLNKLQQQEQRLFKRMLKHDSVIAKELFGDIEGRYNGLREVVRQSRQGISNSTDPYISKLDSLQTSFRFLEQSGLLNNITAGSLHRVKSLQQNANAAELLKNKIEERQSQFKEKFQNTPLAKEFKKFRKDVYYYQQQLNEHRVALNDPKKLGAKMLQAVQKSPAFRAFFQRHSQLAGMFRLPSGGDPANVQSLYGLQTRADLQNLLLQQFGNSPAVRKQVQQNLQAGQEQLQQLKNKVLQNISKGGSGTENLDFNPNNQRTKPFKERLEFGTNVQSQKPNGWFPVTSDLGLSVGFKPNDRSVIGLGASYKLGWGQSIRQIEMSHQGVGLRSFIDLKLKGSFWLSGGYEQNFRSEIKNIEALRGMSAWQQSGLIGLTKVVSLKTKMMKQNMMQLMWDFLSYGRVPSGQTLVFRVGYKF